MTTGYDGRGARFNVTAVTGNDLSFTVTAVDSDAAAVDLSAATIAATVYDKDNTALDTLSSAVSGDDSNIITLSFTDTEVTALTAPVSWALVVTRSGDSRAWLAGRFEVVAADRARNGGTSGTTVTATVDTDVTVTVTALGSSGGGATTLADLTDVTITTPLSGNVVSYDGSGWVNSTPAGGGDMLAANNLSDLDDAATARTNLDVDQAGTDNSTDVTLAGTPDYLTISGQEITRGQIDLSTDVTGDLPVAEGGTGASTASGARTNLGLGTAATSATTDFATGAEGDLAATATQPGDLADVATSGAYGDLSGTPTLGTAAAAATGDFATAAQGSTADTALQPGNIGSTVQGYDADTLKADTADTLTAGFDSSDYAAGTKSSGTYTPDPADGNFQVATNGGAHTLAPPATSCSIVIHYTNNGSAGTITTSGFTAVTGDSFDTTDTNEFMCVVTKINDVSVLNVTALQ